MLLTTVLFCSVFLFMPTRTILQNAWYKTHPHQVFKNTFGWCRVFFYLPALALSLMYRSRRWNYSSPTAHLSAHLPLFFLISLSFFFFCVWRFCLCCNRNMRGSPSSVTSVISYAASALSGLSGRSAVRKVGGDFFLSWSRLPFYCSCQAVSYYGRVGYLILEAVWYLVYLAK